MTIDFFWPFGLVLLIIVAVAVTTGVFNRKRHERNRALAAERGWSYQAKMPGMARQVVSDVGGERSGRAFVGVFEGTTDRGVFYAGTAQWTEHRGSGENQSSETVRRKVVTMPIPLAAPRMRLEREGFLKNIFNRDLKTEWEEFNRAWIVTGEDPRFVSAVLTPTMQEWLMPIRVSYLLKPGWITVYADGRLEAADVDVLLPALTGFCDRITPFLWQDYRQ